MINILMVMLSFLFSFSCLAMEQTYLEREESLKQIQSDSTIKRERYILAIESGDGNTGIIPATILAKMEEALQYDCEEDALLACCFDIMAGTASASGIIPLALNTYIQQENQGLTEAYNLSRLYTTIDESKKTKAKVSTKTNMGFLAENLESFFGNNRLSNSPTHVFLSSSSYVFSSDKAKVDQSADYMMKDIARAFLIGETCNPIGEVKQGQDSDKIMLTEPAYIAAQEAQKLFPNDDLFIVTLGTGEAPRNFSSLNPIDLRKMTRASESTVSSIKSSEDQYQKSMTRLKKEMKEKGKEVTNVRIQLTLGAALIASDNLQSMKQGALYLTNPMNRGEYGDFKKITEKLIQTYKDKRKDKRLDLL